MKARHPSRRGRFVVISTALLVTAIALLHGRVDSGAAARAQRTVSIDNIAGLVSCPTDTNRAGNFALSPLADGVYSSGWVRVSGSTGTAFDWRLTDEGLHIVNMAVVVVQGGGQSAVYTYDYAAGGADDEGLDLRAPGGASISKVEFCFDDKQLRDIINVGGGSDGGGGGSGGGPADLAVTGVVQPTTPRVGDTLVWRLNVLDKNRGPATNLKVTVVFAGPMDFVSGKTDRGSGCTQEGAGTVVCDLDYLSNDSPVGSIVLLSTVKALGDYTATATARYSSPDPQPDDNTIILKASSQAGSGIPTGARPPSVQTLVYVGGALRGRAIKGNRVVFRGAVRFNVAAAVSLVLEDRGRKLRLRLQPGTQVGLQTKKNPGLSFATTAIGAGRRSVVVVARKPDISQGRTYLLTLTSTTKDGTTQRLPIALAY